jgi:nucleoid DNA-binding protein
MDRFGWDLLGKKRIAALEKELADLTSKAGFLNSPKEYEGLPEVRISDAKFIQEIADNFGISDLRSKKILDYIEKKIPEEIAGGGKALSWQGLGTFFSVERNGKWQPRVRFHKQFKDILNDNGEKR